jgi:Protein of unknwon function (DUF3310)
MVEGIDMKKANESLIDCLTGATNNTIEYKFNEDQSLKEIAEYLEKTYTQHYSGKYQATDMIIDVGHGTGFCVGNIMKYAKRYGKKNGFDRRDLLKIIHYAIIQLHVHDKENLK